MSSRAFMCTERSWISIADDVKGTCRGFHCLYKNSIKISTQLEVHDTRRVIYKAKNPSIFTPLRLLLKVHMTLSISGMKIEKKNLKTFNNGTRLKALRLAIGASVFSCLN